MAVRPYFNFSGKELAEVFESWSGEVHTLKELRVELTHRKPSSLRDLRAKVDEAWVKVKKGTTSTSPTASVQSPLDWSRPGSTGPRPETSIIPELPEAPTRGEPRVLTQPTRGKLGSIRPCGVFAGVPSRWSFPDKRDFELEVGGKGTRVDKFVAALRALIGDMRRRGAGMRTVALENGEAVALDGRERGYRFPYEGDAELFEGAKVTIAVGSRSCDGRIVSVTSRWLIVSFDDDLGSTIRSCVLRIDNTAMIAALADRLEKVATGEAGLNLSLADDVLDNRELQTPTSSRETWPDSYRKLNSAQKDFVARALANAVTYLWGPPGTGKTRSLSTINELLFDAGKRILICSNTNQAVDQVLQSLCSTLTTAHPALQDGKVLRIGKTDGIPIEFQDYVTLDGIVRRKSVTLQERKSVLEEDIVRIRASSEEALRTLDLFKQLDGALEAREELMKRRVALERSVSDAERIAREESQSVENLRRELEERLVAGVVRRLLMRSEESIRTDLSKAVDKRDAATKQTQEHRTALNDPTRQEQERAITLRHETLTSVLREKDRATAKRRVEEAEGKAASSLRELADINKKLESIEKSAVADARIIGATVTKTYLSPQQFLNFDVVIIDEASMVMLPAVYYVSGLAKEKVIVSGDFRQLSPIVPTNQAAIQEVIGRDVFQSTGVAESTHGKDAKRTVMLQEQYRMRDGICGMISKRMYDSRLVTTTRQTQHPLPPSPFNGELTVIDTSPIQPFVNRHGSSRYNMMNALAVRNLVRHFYESGFLADGAMDESRLGVCTPFAAQRDVLKRLNEGTGVVVGTVHRYQGDEKLAMIIDIPDSLGEQYVSLFAQAGSPEDAGAKLFNVAVSRAKEHVIFVANLDYLDAKLPSDAFLRELLYTAATRGRVVDVRDVLAMWPITEDLKRIGQPFSLDPETLRSGLFKQPDFEAVCGADIGQAKKSVAIYSGFVTPRRVAAYEALFRRKLAEGVKIRCVTRPPKRNGSIPEELGRDALNGLEVMGCVVDTRWDIHEKVVIIDDEIIWFGSLNPLSHTNSTDEMMARLTGGPAALQLSAFMAIASNVSVDKASGLSVTAENPRCSDCLGRATYRVGSYGPFWQCENECGWKQSVGKTASTKVTEPGSETLSKEGPPCPLCRAKTVLRRGPHGAFYGCSKFPKCKGIVKERKKPKKRTKENDKQTL